MKSFRFVFAAPALASLVFFACGGGDDTAPPKHKASAGEALCKQIAAYAEQCGASAGMCDQALVADCSNVVGLLSDPFIQAVSACLSANAGASPMSCFTQALSTLTPGPAQADLVKGICTTCTNVPLAPASLESSCESAFIQGFDVPTIGHVNVGALFAAVGDKVAQALQTECITSVTDCIPATFSTCAQKVLAEQAFPQNTVDCFLNSILDGGSTSGATTGSCGGGAGGGSSSSTGSSGSGTSTSSTGSGSTSSSGSGGLSCNDPGPEPNDSEASATNEPNSLSCFPIESATVTGMVSGAADVDYFSFPNMTDVCAGPTKPWLQVDGADGDVRFCMFPRCATTAVPDILTCEYGDYATAPDGTLGCCSTASDVKMHLECTAGASTLVDMLVTVDRLEDACGPYQYTLTHASM